jgi:hypothetical protein
MPTPPNFREFSQSCALAARTSKVDSNDRALLKFDMKPVHFIRGLIDKYFLNSSFVTHYNFNQLQKYTTRNRWRLPPAFKRIF